MQEVLLSTTYFGPVQWYQKLHRAEHVLIEQWESFQKQTYRNRCLIATTQGIQALTVPIERTVKCQLSTVNLIKDLRISDHGNWRHQHWVALESSYRQSPFFEYYADDFAPFYEKKWEFLADFNEELMALVASLLDIQKPVARTMAYEAYEANGANGSYGANGANEANEVARPYYQVFASRHGFLPDLSIVDLLFNLGPEGVLWL